MTQPLQEPTPNSQSPVPPLWTVEDVAAYLHFAPETVRGMARSGAIPCIKIGKRVWRFHADQIQAWLEKNRVPAHA